MWLIIKIFSRLFHLTFSAKTKKLNNYRKTGDGSTLTIISSSSPQPKKEADLWSRGFLPSKRFHMRSLSFYQLAQSLHSACSRSGFASPASSITRTQKKAWLTGDWLPRSKTGPVGRGWRAALRTKHCSGRRMMVSRGRRKKRAAWCLRFWQQESDKWQWT